MQALVAIVLVCQNYATKLIVSWRSDWLSEEILVLDLSVVVLTMVVFVL